MQFMHDKPNGTGDMDRVLESIRRSKGEILIKTCRDIEGKNLDYLAGLGLIQEPAGRDARDDEGEIMGSLEARESGSVVFVPFGS